MDGVLDHAPGCTVSCCLSAGHSWADRHCGRPCCAAEWSAGGPVIAEAKLFTGARSLVICRPICSLLTATIRLRISGKLAQRRHLVARVART